VVRRDDPPLADVIQIGKADIRAFIQRHNENPKPYRWTKSADDILASVKRFCQKPEHFLCHEL
jgi:hypothetical protein